jgi:hypothetical protein
MEACDDTGRVTRYQIGWLPVVFLSCVSLTLSMYDLLRSTESMFVKFDVKVQLYGGSHPVKRRNVYCRLNRVPNLL